MRCTGSLLEGDRGRARCLGRSLTDRWRPLPPRALATLAWTASGVLVLAALWQLAVVFAVESQTYMSTGTAQAVWAVAFTPLLAIPALMTAVTWSYAKRHRARGRA